MRNSDRRGVILLEVLVALAIVAIAGVSFVTAMSAAVRAERTAREQEQLIADAERVFTAWNLLTRADLDQRIGIRDVGQYRIDVQHPEAQLYRIAIAAAAAPDRQLLATVLFRPDSVTR